MCIRDRCEDWASVNIGGRQFSVLPNFLSIFMSPSRSDCHLYHVIWIPGSIWASKGQVSVSAACVPELVHQLLQSDVSATWTRLITIHLVHATETTFSSVHLDAQLNIQLGRKREHISMLQRSFCRCRTDKLASQRARLSLTDRRVRYTYSYSAKKWKLRNRKMVCS